MGRVIIKFVDNHLESYKCKSEQRAKEIVDKRRKVKEWNYYEDGIRIRRPKKKIVEHKEMSMEEIEMLLGLKGRWEF